MMDGVLKLLCQSFFTTWTAIVLKVESYKLRPRQVSFDLRWMNIGGKILNLVAVEIVRLRLG